MAKMGFLFDLVSKDKLFQKLFNDADQENTGELDGEQLQAVHASIRPGGISIRQTEASISEICAAETCDIYEFFDVLNEMDRRYFLVKDLQWEFAMLDGKQCGTISEKDARFLFQAVYDEFFSHRRWLDFLKGRRVPGSGISLLRSRLNCVIFLQLNGLSKMPRRRRENVEVHIPTHLV